MLEIILSFCIAIFFLEVRKEFRRWRRNKRVSELRDTIQKIQKEQAKAYELGDDDRLEELDELEAKMRQYLNDINK